MSYTTIHACANDPAFQARLVAAAAQEGHPNPDLVLSTLRWPVASRSDIEEAYEYALTTGNPNPGGDETVITDAMILAAVQEELSPDVPSVP